MPHNGADNHEDHVFDINVSHDPMNWLSEIGMVVMVIILILINISLVISSRKFKRENQYIHTSKAMTSSILTTISFATTAIAFTVTTTITIMSNDFYYGHGASDIFSKISILFYTLSQAVMCYAFVQRIDCCFGGSAVEYSRFLIRSLYCTSIIFLSLWLLMSITLAFEYISVFVVCLSIWIILFLCLSIILCHLFIRRASLILKSTSNNNTVDEWFLYVIVKQSVLVPMAICASFMCFGVVCLIQYLHGSGEWIPAAIFWLVVDCTVTSISIFLLFSWNNSIYDKYCGLLHRCCEKSKMRHMELTNVLSSPSNIKSPARMAKKETVDKTWRDNPQEKKYSENKDVSQTKRDTVVVMKDDKLVLDGDTIGNNNQLSLDTPKLVMTHSEPSAKRKEVKNEPKHQFNTWE